MTKRLNHSRYLDYGARDVGDFAVQRAKETPTAKQRKFYNRLYSMCKSNGINTNTGNYTRIRGDFVDYLSEEKEKRIKESEAK